MRAPVAVAMRPASVEAPLAHGQVRQHEHGRLAGAECLGASLDGLGGDGRARRY